MSELKHYALSFTGRRDNNQDACVVNYFGNSTCFLAVADGMGGVHGGQIASNLILKHAQKILQETLPDNLQPDELKETISKVFNTAQQALSDRIKEEPELSGMGTTLTAVLIKDNKFVWGNIGDSRIYLLRKKEFKQLTDDHTYVEEYKKTNSEEIPDNILEQYSHYLTRAIDGGADSAEIFPEDKNYEELEDGDVLLLCSDGMITNKANTDTETIKKYILGTDSVKDAAQNLVTQAYENNSKDNISVIVAEHGNLKREVTEITKHCYPPKGYISQKFFNNKYFRIYFAIIILLVLIISAILILK